MWSVAALSPHSYSLLRRRVPFGLYPLWYFPFLANPRAPICMINYVRWKPLESSKLVIKWNNEFQWLVFMLPLDQNRTHWIKYRPTTQWLKLATVVVFVHLCSYTAKVEPLFSIRGRSSTRSIKSWFHFISWASSFNPYHFSRKVT